ncbi:HD-domain/PDEase-like protein [Artomyces pyxidatus]|uniref:HD-domain/PDEase-like protein n=1 Tax=Artomyces pyxidatus TaxID=48021 RepID=A0ACB8TES4_9AGAM|nr:HD-domain/PDEase-like protein [Artomyces pyxidatus]
MHRFDDGQPLPGQPRRRSVDVGGLALALGDEGLGQGWGGWDDTDEIPCYAELLSDMYTHTHLLVDGQEQSPLLTVPPECRTRLIESLDSWNFEPHKLPDEEVLYCALILFQALFRVDGLSDAVQVSLEQVADLLCNLRKAYRHQNSYHNFEHALDVLQAIHRFLCSAGRVPPVSILLEGTDRSWRPDKQAAEPALVSCLTPEDMFCLYVASIGHDVGHPGFTNVFMKNAKAPLSSLYDDKSPLEQMHCTLLLHILRRQGLGFLLDSQEITPLFRKLLAETVLATDMRVHIDFMHRFQRIISGEETDVYKKKVIVCQALIKCADISNPCRPLRVSEHWASALMEEWTSQAILERYLHLPPSVKASEDPIAEAESQVWFIETFARPLFELTAAGIPECAEYAAQCNENLELWRLRARALSSSTSPPADAPLDSILLGRENPHVPSQLPEDFLNAFPMTLPTSLLLSAEQCDRPSWPPFCQAHSTAPSSCDSASSCASSPVLPSTIPPLSTASSSPSLSPSEISSDAPPSRAISIAGSIVNLGTGNNANSGTAAIRAAYKASIRKKTSFHRNSWSPGSRAAPPVLSPGLAASAAAGVSARREMMAIAAAP